MTSHAAREMAEKFFAAKHPDPTLALEHLIKGLRIKDELRLRPTLCEKCQASVRQNRPP